MARKLLQKCNDLLLATLILSAIPSFTRADYTITLDKHEDRGTWEGWGCSLCWWAQGIGDTAYQNLYADLFFTQKTVAFFGKKLPGLGMNLVRYNVGGGGRNEAIDGIKENVPPKFPWFKDMDGFWINGRSSDPNSDSWDWTRDAEQRSMLLAARDRGVNLIEFFSNAPMWWMMDSKSSAGGNLQAQNRRDFAHYLASVVKVARERWKVNVTSIEPFNEPSAGWWNYPKEQEGCNISPNQQKEVLGFLSEALDARGLKQVTIAASDENSMPSAKATYDYFKTQNVSVNGQPQTVADLIGKVNVHAYSGLEPWRDNKARQVLRASVGRKRLWMTEYGDNEGSGMALAQTITEDLTYLRPTAWVYWQPAEPYSAWVYWQPAEPYSAWGLVNGKYADRADLPDRGTPTWVYTKYYVMAQFTRFLRPGCKLLGNNDHNTVIAYNPARKQLVCITVNYGNAQQITYDLSTLSRTGATASLTLTNTDGSKLLHTQSLILRNKTLTLSAEANSIYSIVIPDVRL